MVPPVCSHQRLVNWMCTLVLNARSVGRPAVVQYSQLLKFQRSCWKTWLGRCRTQHGPGGPRLLVGLAQEADVVDLEPGRAALVGGLEVEPFAADLGEPDLAGCRRRARCGWSRTRASRPGAGRGAPDPAGSARSPAASPATRLRSNEPETSYSVGEPPAPVHPAGVGASVQVRLARGVERPVHSGQDEADAAVAAGGSPGCARTTA